MKVTKRFKKLLSAAKADGYENVYSVVGAYRATTYCVFNRIDKILEKPEGYDYGRQRPYHTEYMWTDHPNTRMVGDRDIMYHEVFRIYGKGEK